MCVWEPAVYGCCSSTMVEDADDTLRWTAVAGRLDCTGRADEKAESESAADHAADSNAATAA